MFRNAADIKLQEFNDAGGMPGATITVRYEDSKNDAKEGRNIAQMFVDDKSIVGVLGDFNSTVSMAAAEIYAKDGMPQLSQTASHPDFVKISKWQFRNITTQATKVRSTHRLDAREGRVEGSGGRDPERLGPVLRRPISPRLSRPRAATVVLDRVLQSRARATSARF